MVKLVKQRMFKNCYNRVKKYLNSYSSFGTIFFFLLILAVPVLTYKIKTDFLSILLFSYQYMIVNLLVLFLYITNIWNYLQKNFSIVYQAHRYGSVKRVVKNVLGDVLLLILVLDLVFFILSISSVIMFNSGYIMSMYETYNIPNLYYLIYYFIIRFIFILIIAILTFLAYYTNNKELRFFIMSLVIFNLLDLGNNIPITMNSILSGNQFSSFGMEILSTIIMIGVYIVLILILKKIIINKKRDIG